MFDLMRFLNLLLIFLLYYQAAQGLAKTFGGSISFLLVVLVLWFVMHVLLTGSVNLDKKMSQMIFLNIPVQEYYRATLV